VGWTGRLDREEGAGPWRWHEVVRDLPAGVRATPGVALLGFACDAGVARNHGRTGAAEGPAALRPVLANLPLQSCRLLYDAGDVRRERDALEAAQAEYAARTAALLADGHLPIGLGGGHEIAYGSFRGLADRFETAVSASRAGASPAPRIGIVNFDAHFDLRAGERATSGTPFRQIAEHCAARSWPFRYFVAGVSRYANTTALFDRATALGVRWLLDDELTQTRLELACEALAAFVDDVDVVYLTLCLDVLPAGVAPGVSAPAARGVPLEVLEPLVDVVAGSGRLAIADVAELAPAFDPDGRTARTAARLVARVVERAWSARRTALGPSGG
jgi:formiminoglutamase